MKPELKYGEFYYDKLLKNKVRYRGQSTGYWGGKLNPHIFVADTNYEEIFLLDEEVDKRIVEIKQV